MEKPWQIKEIVMTKPGGVNQGHIDIHIDFEKGHKFPRGKTHDTVERTWQHINFFQHKCFLHAREQRIFYFLRGGKIISLFVIILLQNACLVIILLLPLIISKGKRFSF